MYNVHTSANNTHACDQKLGGCGGGGANML